MAVNQGLIRTVTKIHKIGDELIATSGNFGFGKELIEWYRRGADPKCYPECQKDKDDWVDLLVITKDRIIKKYERAPYPMIFEDITYAMGSGRDYAIAAMACGKDAREAVLRTCELSNECGCGVDTLSFI